MLGRWKSPEISSRGRSKSSNQDDKDKVMSPKSTSKLGASGLFSGSTSRSPARSDRSGASHRFQRDLVENKYGNVHCVVQMNPDARLYPTSTPNQTPKSFTKGARSVKSD